MLGVRRAGEAVILVLGQAAGQLRLEALDICHRRFDGLGNVLVFREVEQGAVTGVVGQVKTAPGHGDFVNGPFAAGALEAVKFRLDGLLMAAVVDVGEFEENQAEYRGAVFGGVEV